MPSTTTTTISPAQLAALLNSLNSDLAKASAINSYLQAQAAAAAVAAAAQTGQPAPVPAAASADPSLLRAAADQLNASNAKQAAQRRYDKARQQLGRLGVALYVHADTAGDTPSVAASAASGVDRSVLLSMLLGEVKSDFSASKRTLTGAIEALAIAKIEADQLVNARAEAIAQTRRAAPLSAPGSAPTTSAPVGPPPPGQPSTTRPTTPPYSAAAEAASPTILGSSALSGGELSAWYTSAGHQPRLTVPLDTLTGDYQATGAAMNVRDDIAFAQAMVETGYLDFPPFGQVTPTDNNYAGIGACDTCAHGFTFPDAQTGVAAHLQLLHDDATMQPVPGPLPAPVGVAGCCSTWLALDGIWATAGGYGYHILLLYRQMLEWVLQRRTSSAGL